MAVGPDAFAYYLRQSWWIDTPDVAPLISINLIMATDVHKDEHPVFEQKLQGDPIADVDRHRM
jgi:hypothetical protein